MYNRNACAGKRERYPNGGHTIREIVSIKHKSRFLSRRHHAEQGRIAFQKIRHQIYLLQGKRRGHDQRVGQVLDLYQSFTAHSIIK